MTVKHKPETPLPWAADVNNPNWNGDIDSHGTAVRSVSVARAKRDQDTAYITHAANAYPKLVEALKRAQQREYNSFEPDNQSNVYKEHAALLTELGETS